MAFTQQQINSATATQNAAAHDISPKSALWLGLARESHFLLVSV